MALHTYTEDQRRLILSSLHLRKAISDDMVIDDLQTAWKFTAERKDAVISTVPEKTVIKELQKIIDVHDGEIRHLVEQLSKEASWLFALSASIYWKEVQQLADGHITPDFLLDEATWSVILNADPDKLRNTARSAIADFEQEKEHKDKSSTWNIKFAQRGQPVNFPAYSFTEAVYRTFYHATGKLPSRRIDKWSGASYGPFHDFLDAAIRPTQLIREDAKVDNLVRLITTESMVNDGVSIISDILFFHSTPPLKLPPPD